VRQLIGYDRFEGLLAYRQLAELYRVIRLYVNYFQPSMKLVKKTREGAKVSKSYDVARTPCQRLVGSGALDPGIQEQMKAAYQILDPVELLRQMEVLQDAFWRHAQAAAKPNVRSDHAAVTAQLAMRKPFETGIQLNLRCRKRDPMLRHGHLRSVLAWIPTGCGIANASAVGTYGGRG
jgi:hypothetical protein